MILYGRVCEETACAIGFSEVAHYHSALPYHTHHFWTRRIAVRISRTGETASVPQAFLPSILHHGYNAGTCPPSESLLSCSSLYSRVLCNHLLPSTTDFLSRSCFSTAFPPCDLGTLPTVQEPRLVIPMTKANMPRNQISQISVR